MEKKGTPNSRSANERLHRRSLRQDRATPRPRLRPRTAGLRAPPRPVSSGPGPGNGSPDTRLRGGSASGCSVTGRGRDRGGAGDGPASGPCVTGVRRPPAPPRRCEAGCEPVIGAKGRQRGTAEPPVQTPGPRYRQRLRRILTGRARPQSRGARPPPASSPPACRFQRRPAESGDGTPARPAAHAPPPALVPGSGRERAAARAPGRWSRPGHGA